MCDDIHNFELYSILLYLCAPLCCRPDANITASLPSGGRGSYNDMSGPVVTTQVTIPKDVSK